MRTEQVLVLIPVRSLRQNVQIKYITQSKV